MGDLGAAACHNGCGRTPQSSPASGTGGRGQKFRELPEEERRTQEEEAYARATVALTRARKMCVIFCPLDMKGLMYGAGHCWHGAINVHLRGSSLEDCPGDNQFLSSLDLTDVTIIINHNFLVSTPTPPLLFPLHPSRGHLVTSIHSMILDPANCTLALCHLVTGKNQ